MRISNYSLLAMAQQLINLLSSDYNRYCGDERDPGVTGIDLCYGVRQVSTQLRFLVKKSRSSCCVQPWLFKCIVSFFSIVKLTRMNSKKFEKTKASVYKYNLPFVFQDVY